MTVTLTEGQGVWLISNVSPILCSASLLISHLLPLYFKRKNVKCKAKECACADVMKRIYFFIVSESVYNECFPLRRNVL